MRPLLLIGGPLYSDMSPSELLQLANTLMARADEILDLLEAKCDQIEARELADKLTPRIIQLCARSS